MRTLDAQSGDTPKNPVLVQHHTASDPETGGAYSIKCYASEKTTDGDLWHHERITLSPLNPDFAPMVFGPETPENTLEIVAEYISVVVSA